MCFSTHHEKLINLIEEEINDIIPEDVLDKKSSTLSKPTSMKTKPPCKEGKARNANRRCVKIENIKTKSLYKE